METQIVNNIMQAEALAKQVMEHMGTDFFRTGDMRKKMVKQEGKHIKKLSWSEAENYMTYLMSFGFCEEVEKNFRIRLDVAFRKQVYETQKTELENKISAINIVLSLLDAEHEKHAPKKAAKKAVKKTPKKTVKQAPKKAVKKTAKK